MHKSLLSHILYFFNVKPEPPGDLTWFCKKVTVFSVLAGANVVMLPTIRLHEQVRPS
jgi:hypothetical protein